MKIKTITCHEVYNHGASLQEYALLKYLESLGHEAETIHYKPDYLSNHFNFWSISNPKYDKPFIKILYVISKFPERFLSLKKKRSFDAFSEKNIKATAKLYRTNEDLKRDLPEADVYICGSDQIWNSFFENGKDPAFYLDFVPDNKLKLSYAASFAIDTLEDDIKEFVKEKVSRLDFVSVRETSGIQILENLGINNVNQVLDPVFLLEPNTWQLLCEKSLINFDYIFVYDFESNPLIEQFVKNYSKIKKFKIVSVNKNIDYADYNYPYDGPITFLTLLNNAKFVVSNSFHAVAFSVIFSKQFIVFNRNEKINTRMRDFVNLLEIPFVLITNKEQLNNYNELINYNEVIKKLNNLIKQSKQFINKALNKNYDS